jgi:predicted DNA binding CopG/RHH family protein
MLAYWLEEAAGQGKLTSMEKVAALPARRAASKNIAIRVPLDDLERARRLAARKGLQYQTYVKDAAARGAGQGGEAGGKN